MRALITAVAGAATLLAGFGAAAQPAPVRAAPMTPAAAYAELDPIFEAFAREAHVPGMVYGVVADGRLAYVRTLGVQDTVSKRPVTPDSVFRIASMTKNFTALAALKLRDEGRLAFDAPAETVIPEMAGWRYPTSDSPRIRIRDLLSHTPGLVTDDPFGDRQLAMSDAEFSRYVRAGVPFARAPETAMDYSNFGYMLLGRAVQNASGRPYADYVEDKILAPLGMRVTTYEVARVPTERRALGYRWQDDAWIEEPVLAHGAGGAMGGLHTSANDYARYIAFVLSAWPARDGLESPVLRRSSVREVVHGQNFPRLIRRPVAERADPNSCDRAAAYGLGVIVSQDCRLGFAFTHSGGLPGYGSNVLFLPERGVAVFAFTNLTYAPAATAVQAAAYKLVESGAFPVRPVPASPGLTAMHAAAERIYATGDVLSAPDALATNLLLDRDAPHRNAELARLKAELGACPSREALEPASALNGQAFWRCERGRLRARMLLAPTAAPALQSLEFAKVD